jgi:hypothetical protein
MSIKKLVNDPQIWQGFLEEVDTWLEREYKFLEQARDIVDIHKAQGSVKTLRKLKNLRDIVNGRD